ncbi:MAG: HD domain-containing protein [Chloroflexi bacterium]|nr:MAG: HD domain-containing protein [Chloroflexota bacterium]
MTATTLARSEAERTLDQLGQRARVGVAITVATFVVLARQIGEAPDNLLARGFVIAVGFFIAVLAHDLPIRLRQRTAAVAAGVLADVAATSLAVLLLFQDFPLAPVALLWPVFTVGLVANAVYVLGVAALETIVLLAIAFTDNASVTDAFTASGWGLLYFVVAFAYSEILRQFRSAQRATETAMTHSAGLAFCSTAEEVGEMLFDFVDIILGTTGSPAALLHDERDAGAHVAIAARGIDPDTRTRLRLVDSGSGDVLALVQDGGMWTDPRRLSERLALAGPMLEAKSLFIVPLRDQRRIVGALLVACPRERRMSEEAQRGVARVAAQAAAALQRLRAARLVQQQRAAMSFLLDVRRAGDDASAIAAWAARAARDLTGASGAAVVSRQRNSYRTLAVSALQSDDLLVGAKPFLDAIFARQLPIVVADLAQDQRFALSDVFSGGSLVGVPVHGEGAALLVNDKRADALTSAQVELMIMLADQVALLLSRAHAVAHGIQRGGEVVQGRVAELAERMHSPRAELEARMVEALRLAIEGNQPHLAGSGDRVGRLGAALAQRAGLDEIARDQVYVAALLRDVGQLGIDRAIFERSRALAEPELAIVHQHPVLGESILASLGFLQSAASIVRAHHERWDGTGYPDGASGEHIPLGARILAVADGYHAMTSERPYRTAFSPQDAVRTIVDASAHAFDPKIVEAFAALAESSPQEVASSST